MRCLGSFARNRSYVQLCSCKQWVACFKMRSFHDAFRRRIWKKIEYGFCVLRGFDCKSIPGRHIKLIWSREEDMSQGRYHPAMMAQITASIDTQNQLAGMNIRLSGESFRKRAGYPVVKLFNGVDPFVFEGLSESKTDLVNKVVNSSKSPTPLAYDFKNYKIDFSQFDSHIKLGPLRGTHAIHNIFAIECFMDDLAHHLNIDALEFRLKHMMANPRQLNVLESVAQSIGWNQPKRPGIFKGLSQCTFQNSLRLWHANCLCQLTKWSRFTALLLLLIRVMPLILR